jgi:phytanoyl-CoA hydroxylase
VSIYLFRYGRTNQTFPHVTKEICNIWKSDRLIAGLVLSYELSSLAAQLMPHWNSVRIAQDDLFHKPALGSAINFHRDSDYISSQFSPTKDNSVTIWIALDDVESATGTLQYAVGSHKWHKVDNKPNLTSAFHNPESNNNSANKAAHYQSALMTEYEAQKNVPFLQLEDVELAAGGVSIHHQDLLHGSNANMSNNRERRTLAVHLINGDVKFHSNHSEVSYIYGRYKLRDSVELLEDFFPITWPLQQRSKFLAQYCRLS